MNGIIHSMKGMFFIKFREYTDDSKSEEYSDRWIHVYNSAEFLISKTTDNYILKIVNESQNDPQYKPPSIPSPHPDTLSDEIEALTLEPDLSRLSSGFEDEEEEVKGDEVMEKKESAEVEFTPDDGLQFKPEGIIRNIQRQAEFNFILEYSLKINVQSSEQIQPISGEPTTQPVMGQTEFSNNLLHSEAIKALDLRVGGEKVLSTENLVNLLT